VIGPTLIGSLFFLTLLTEPVRSKRCVGVCKSRFEKTRVYGRPEESKRAGLRRRQVYAARGSFSCFLKLALARSYPALPIDSSGEPGEEEQRANQSGRIPLSVTIQSLYKWYPGMLLDAGFLFGLFSALNVEVIPSSVTSVHIRTTRRYILEDGSTHNYRCENPKSYHLFLICYSRADFEEF
jgi:hypothetical protein